MKKRKSICILSTIAVVMFVASFVLFFGCWGIFSNFSEGIKAAGTAIQQSFRIFTAEGVSQITLATAYMVVVVFAILFIFWLVISINRKAKVGIFFCISWAIVCFNTYVYAARFTQAFHATFEAESALSSNEIMMIVGYILAKLGFFVYVALFIVDMATGRHRKQCCCEEHKEECKCECCCEEHKEEVAEAAPVVEEAPVEEVKEEKSSEVKEEKGEEQVKSEKVEKKVAKKPAAKKAAPKKAEAKKEAPAKEEKKSGNTKVYHVSKRAEDGLWVIKFAGGEKVIKTFKTRREAVDYADVLAKNQEGIVLTHASKGKKQGKIWQKRKAI